MGTEHLLGKLHGPAHAEAEACGLGDMQLLSAGCGGHDARDLAADGVDALLQIQRARIDEHGVRRAAQGRCLAVLIGVIPIADVLKHLLIVRLDALFGKLPEAALGAALGGGGEENFQRRVRQDDRADIAPVHDDALAARHAALRLHEKIAHKGIGRDLGGAHGVFRRADLRGDVLPAEQHPLYARVVIRQLDLKLRQQRAHGVGVLAGRAGAPDGVRNRAVNGARVHIDQPEAPGCGAGDGALSGTGGPVDGDGNIG